jgi:hypothetical protein
MYNFGAKIKRKISNACWDKCKIKANKYRPKNYLDLFVYVLKYFWHRKTE